MNRKNRKIFFIILFLIAFNVYSSPLDSGTNEYLNKYSLALSSNSREEIETCIEYFRSIISNGNRIESIYYNLAQLYYRLGQYNEAIETLDEWDSPAKEYYKATLEIRIGNIKEARNIIENMISTLDDYFNTNSNINPKALNSYILYSNYLGFDFNKMINDLLEKGIITKEQIEESKNAINIFGEDLLINIWPK